MKSKKKRVYLYSRVSTGVQDTQNQKIALQRWLTENPQEDARMVSEVISGRKMTGESLVSLWNAVKAGEVSKVVVVSLDRLGRNMLQACHFVQDCLDNGVEVVVTSQPDLKLDTPTGKMVFQVMFSLAEYELNRISERTKAAFPRIKATCKACGHFDAKNLQGKVFLCLKCGGDTPRFRGGTPGQHWMSAKVAGRVDEVIRLHGAGFSNRYIWKTTGLDQRTISRIIREREDLPTVRPRTWDQ